MAAPGAPAQAWTSAEAALPLGWQLSGVYRFLLVGMLMLAGCQTALPSPSEGPRRSAGPDPSQPGLTHEFEGFGALSTEDFALRGGNYRIDWSFTAVPGYPCNHWVLLRDQTGRSQTVLDMFGGGDEKIYDSTYAPDLAPGTYQFDVNSTCDWTLLIEEDNGSSQ